LLVQLCNVFTPCIQVLGLQRTDVLHVLGAGVQHSI
jgi:hypothetical protein